MSTKHLDELGVPRRAFLKKAGAAALAAPVIVSFGMDAIAEGSTSTGLAKPGQCFPNQTFANQQLSPGAPLWRILDLLLSGVYEGTFGGKPHLTIGDANPLAQLAMLAGLQESAKEYLAADHTWTNFIAQVNSRSTRIPQDLVERLIEDARRAQDELHCT